MIFLSNQSRAFQRKALMNGKSSFDVAGAALGKAEKAGDEGDNTLITSITIQYADGTERRAEICVWRASPEGELANFVVSLSFLNPDGSLIGENDEEELDCDGIECTVWPGILTKENTWTLKDIVKRWGFDSSAPIWTVEEGV